MGTPFNLGSCGRNPDVIVSMNKPKIITFDIETEPLDSEHLIQTYEPKFEANRTLKDPLKISSDLSAKQDAWIADSALYAERARVLAIGFKTDGKFEILEGSEKTILTECIKRMFFRENYIFAGFNILGFDLPFIRRRCILNCVTFPFYDRSNKWSPWKIRTFDAMVDWSGTSRDTISLDTLARALGVGKKNESGKDFAALYKTDREKALAYLENDLEITAKVCERMMQC